MVRSDLRIRLEWFETTQNANIRHSQLQHKVCIFTLIKMLLNSHFLSKIEFHQSSTECTFHTLPATSRFMIWTFFFSEDCPFTNKVFKQLWGRQKDRPISLIFLKLITQRTCSCEQSNGTNLIIWQRICAWKSSCPTFVMILVQNKTNFRHFEVFFICLAPWSSSAI